MVAHSPAVDESNSVSFNAGELQRRFDVLNAGNQAERSAEFKHLDAVAEYSSACFLAHSVHEEPMGCTTTGDISSEMR